MNLNRLFSITAFVAIFLVGLSTQAQSLCPGLLSKQTYQIAPVTYGKHAIEKFRKHAEQIRRLARRSGIFIPAKISSSETQTSIYTFVQYVVTYGDTRVGRYKQFQDALWSKLGDAYVIRKNNGEFLTFLDGGGEGATLNYPGF